MSEIVLVPCLISMLTKMHNFIDELLLMVIAMDEDGNHSHISMLCKFKQSKLLDKTVTTECICKPRLINRQENIG